MQWSMKPKARNWIDNFPAIQRAKRELVDYGPEQMFSFENSEIFFDTFVLDDFLLIDLFFPTNYLVIQQDFRSNALAFHFHRLFPTFSNRHAVNLLLRFNSIFCTRIYSSATIVFYHLYLTFLSISNCRFMPCVVPIPLLWISYSNATNMIDMSSQIIPNCYLCFENS